MTKREEFENYCRPIGEYIKKYENFEFEYEELVRLISLYLKLEFLKELEKAVSIEENKEIRYAIVSNKTNLPINEHLGIYNDIYFKEKYNIN